MCQETKSSGTLLACHVIGGTEIEQSRENRRRPVGERRSAHLGARITPPDGRDGVLIIGFITHFPIPARTATFLVVPHQGEDQIFPLLVVFRLDHVLVNFRKQHLGLEGDTEQGVAPVRRMRSTDLSSVSKW